MSKKTKNKKGKKKKKYYIEPDNELINANGLVEDNKSYMVSIKTRLNKITINPNVKIERIGKSFNEILEDCVNRVNKIVFHTYAFLKAYILKNFNKNNPNIVDVQLIRDIMNVITFKNQRKGMKPNINPDIKKFYDNHYSKILTKEDLICRDKLKHILNYEEQAIINNISNNISENFMSHLRFVIYVYFGFKDKIDKLKTDNKTEEVKSLLKTFDNVVSDIINIENNDIISSEKYHRKILFMREMAIPKKESYGKKYIPYDVKANPFDYLPSMINLNRILEILNNTIILEHKDTTKNPIIYRLFNVLPFRTNIVPKHITIDTPALISLFIVKNQKQLMKNQKSFITRKKLWRDYFKLDSKCFKRKGYRFANIIKTDGIACSIIFQKCDKNGRLIKAPNKLKLKADSKCRKHIPYIEDVEITSLMRCKDIVTIDPNKYDIISAMKEVYRNNRKEYIHFEYTRGQRNKDRKKKKADRIRKNLMKEKINNRTVFDIQNELKVYNHKSCDYGNFMKYLVKKIEINRILYNHYSQPIYRLLNFRNYINTKRSESLMINRFKSKMGEPSRTIIVIGDYSDNGLRGTPPSMTVKLRNIFKTAGYEVFLIDEFNTSKTCSCCKGKLEKFINIKRTKKEWKLLKDLRKNISYINDPAKMSKIHLNKMNIDKEIISSKKVARNGQRMKLLRCKTCKAIHNRDHNATKNMMIIVKSIYAGEGRPQPYQRAKEKWNKEKREVIEV